MKFGELFGKRKAEDAVLPSLSSALKVPGGPFGFSTQLDKGSLYEIEASTDLRTWQTIASGAVDEALVYEDSDARRFNCRFYRLRSGQACSANVIGYVSISLPPGFSMIANPLEGPGNGVGEVFNGWPDGTTLNKFDTRRFQLSENAVKLGRWANPAERLQPGEGAIFLNPTSEYRSVCFTGQVTQGNLSVPIPAGFSVRSSQLPQAGSLDAMEFPIANGDVVHLFDRDAQKYVLYPYENGKWTAGPPVVGVGESFWVAKTAPGNWTRTRGLEG